MMMMRMKSKNLPASIFMIMILIRSHWQVIQEVVFWFLPTCLESKWNNRRVSLVFFAKILRITKVKRLVQTCNLRTKSFRALKNTKNLMLNMRIKVNYQLLKIKMKFCKLQMQTHIKKMKWKNWQHHIWLNQIIHPQPKITFQPW